MYWRWSSCFLVLCAAEQRLAADELSLVQKSVDGPSSASWQVVDPATGLVKASKTHALQKQAVVSMAASKGVKRILDNFNGTRKSNTVVNMLKWSLTGKITEWVMGMYREPREASELTAIDGLISLLTSALSDNSKLSNEEVLGRIFDWGKIHKLFYDYGVAEGELPEVMQVVDAVGQALEEKKPHSIPEARLAITSAFSKVSAGPMADLMKYCFDVITKKEKSDIGTTMLKLQPALKEAGVPESAVSYIMDTLEGRRSGEKLGFNEMLTRTSYALAEASDDLNMPPAFSHFLTDLGTFASNPTNGNVTYIIFKISDLGLQVSQMAKDIGLPQEVADWPKLMGRCIMNYGYSKLADHGDEWDLARCQGPILANASLAIGHPPAIAEYINFFFSNLIGKTAFDKMIQTDPKAIQDREAKRLELHLKTLEQAGIPPAYVTMVRKLYDDWGTGKLTEITDEKSKQMVMDVMRMFGAPAMSTMLRDVMNLLDMKRKGTTPSAEVVFKLFVSAIDLPGDISRLRTNFKRIDNRVLGPVHSMVGASLQNISSNMPESFLKRLVSRTAHQLQH